MGKKKRVTFYIDEKLHKDFNIHAVSSIPKKSMSQLVEDLLREYLQRKANRVSKKV